MSYFKKFPLVSYQFGSNTVVLGKQAFQNIGAYVDVIDQYVDNVATYQYYSILDGDRPDVVSQKFYDTPEYHWTFFLMNPDIRESGWPLSRTEMDDFLAEEYPGSVIATRTDFFGSIIAGTNNAGPTLKVGDVLTGSVSAATGTVKKLDPDNGQIFIEETASFSAGEAATWTDDDGVVQTIVVVSNVAEYLAADHYIDGDGEITDIGPTVGPGGLLTEVTIKDAHETRNDELREMRIIPPQYIDQIVDAFNSTMAG